MALCAELAGSTPDQLTHRDRLWGVRVSDDALSLVPAPRAAIAAALDLAARRSPAIARGLAAAEP